MGLAVPLSVFVPLSGSLILPPKEESLNLNLSRLILVKVINSLRGGFLKKWTQEENRILMECYYWSKLKINGYRQQMHAIWRDKVMFNITEQRLMYEESQIRKKQCLTKLELEEIQRRTEDKSHGYVPNDS